VDELAGLNKKMDEIQARIQNSKMPAKSPVVDYKALAHALKIDKFPKAADKLKAAMKLQGQARAKALDALQKDSA